VRQELNPAAGQADRTGLTIGAAELRFTAAEAAALLSAVTGAGLPADSVAALTARTEGWAATMTWSAVTTIWPL
jgi:ATP/maltotriose-dependent transcriptional regulator MalT